MKAGEWIMVGVQVLCLWVGVMVLFHELDVMQEHVTRLERMVVPR